MKTIAIVDADILAFRCSAANATRSIRATHKMSGQVIECPHRTALKEQIKGAFELDEFDIEDVQTAADISFAFNAMNTCLKAWKQSVGASSVELYISGENNFRDYLPLPTKYKSNRSGIKPVQLQECRQYLIERKKAVVVNGKEVDDHLAQRCYEGLKQGIKTVAVTNDGDQNGVAGWMYNWTKMNEPKLICGLGDIWLNDERNDFDGHGRKFFYAQWLYGDWNVDRFKPAELSGKKFGVVAMYNILKDCNTDKECVQAVYNQYSKWYPEPVTYTAWDGAEHTKDVIEIMDMYAACAHMKRFDGDVFDTRKLLNKLEIEV
jgi:hypothetical protein